MPPWSTGVWADTGRVSDGRRLWASALQSNQHYKLRVALLSSCTAFAHRAFYAGTRGVTGVLTVYTFCAYHQLSTPEARENYKTMTDSSSTAFHRALDNIGKCKGAADFRDWGGGMRQAMGLHALEMLHVLGGAPCSEPTKEREAWKKANNNLFSVLFFMTEGSSHITVRAHESKELGSVGNGAATWNALKEQF